MMKKINVGDFLSEQSHYEVVSITPSSANLHHMEADTDVTVSLAYIKELMNSANEFLEERAVTKADKRDGTPGIRTIFENISGPEVFTVCFKKQNTPKTKTALNKEKDKRVEAFVEAIEKAKSSKKSISLVAARHFEELIKNPILPYVEGEDRILRGYKIQFQSADGRYQCMDMEIKSPRPVNINTIKWLIYKGVKYTVTE